MLDRKSRWDTNIYEVERMDCDVARPRGASPWQLRSCYKYYHNLRQSCDGCFTARQYKKAISRSCDGFSIQVWRRVSYFTSRLRRKMELKLCSKRSSKHQCGAVALWSFFLFHRLGGGVWGHSDISRVSMCVRHLWKKKKTSSRLKPHTLLSVRPWTITLSDTNLSHLTRLWHFSSSVNSFFKRACAAIQWD